MPIKFKCRHCGHIIRVGSEAAGKRGPCPGCSESVRVPVPKQLDEFADEDDLPPRSSSTRSAKARPKSGSKRRGKKQTSKSTTNPAIYWGIGGGVAVLLAVVAFMAFSGGDSENDAANIAQANSIQPATTQPRANANTASPATSGTRITASKPTEPVEPTEPTILTVSDVVKKVQDGVVMVSVADDDGEELGFGSGFVIDLSGLVATNFHVIEMGQQATVKFRDGTELPVEGVIAWSEERDLAILKVRNLQANSTVLSLADNAPTSGEDLVAIGHPKGFQFTTTTGIVSAMHTTDTLPDKVQRFLSAPQDQVWIQTNATIAGGSSGGPLLNRRGEVVGVNTWITTDVNFGFASSVRHLADLLAQPEKELTSIADANGSGKIRKMFEALTNLDPEVQALFDEYTLKIEEFAVSIKSTRSVQQLQSMMSKHPAVEYSDRFMKLASSKQDTPAAYQSLIVCLNIVSQIKVGPSMDGTIQEIVKQLEQSHIEEPSLFIAAIALRENTTPAARSFLGSLSEQSPHRDVRGMAYFCLAASLAASENPNTKQLDQAVAMLDTVIEDYSDVEFGGKELGSVVEPLRFELKHMAVGRPAPNIVGKDSQGDPLELADYKDKVVVLDFFANWCPHCTKMYPFERVLVKDYQDRPFALLGINSDPSSVLDGLVEQGKVTWKTWADGQHGPIAQEWNISSFPTMVILDHKGVIRHRFQGAPSSDALRRLVDQLVREAENELGLESPEPKPTVTTAGPATDVLELVRKITNAPPTQGGEIVFGNMQRTLGTTVRLNLPEEFQLDITMARVRGDAMAIGFATANRAMVLTFDGDEVALRPAQTDTYGAKPLETARLPMPLGRAVEFTLTVKRDRIEVRRGSRTILSWQDDHSERFLVPPTWSRQGSSVRGIHVSSREGIFRFEKMDFRAIVNLN